MKRADRWTKDDVPLLLEAIPNMNAEEIAGFSARVGSVDRRVTAAFAARIRELEEEARREGFYSRALRELVRLYFGA